MKLDSTKILEEKKIQYRLIKLSKKGVSCEDVVKFAKDKVKPEEICKTIIVKDKKNNKYAFFLKGNTRIDSKKAKNIVGKKISIISFDDLKQTTGKEPGAVCPFLLDMSIFVDKAVFNTKKINLGSGNHLYGIEIDSSDLEKVIDFKLVDAS